MTGAAAADTSPTLETNTPGESFKQDDKETTWYHTGTEMVPVLTCQIPALPTM